MNPTLEIIEHFGLGLSIPYWGRKSGREHADALMYPLLGWDGRFYNKYGYYNIPEVTLNPVDSNGWISGEARAYYRRKTAGKTMAFVCQRPLDLWRHWQALEATGIGRDIVLISSTHESVFPAEWKEARYWAGWDVVYLGIESDLAGESLCANLAEVAGRDVRRVLVPASYGKDWTAFRQGGADTKEFTSLLRDAPFFSLKLRGETEEAQGYGRFPYQPVNINGAFHNGHLYYTVQIGVEAPATVGKITRGEECAELDLVLALYLLAWAKCFEVVFTSRSA